MGTFIIIVIIIFILFAVFGKKKAPNTYKNNRGSTERELTKNILKNIKIKVTTTSGSYNYRDDSIINITGESYKINSANSLKRYSDGIPYWAHHYVYSYSEINSATLEQRRFYEIFKNNFLNGEYFDLEGNTNYAFILLFELLEEYEKHRDIVKLENRIITLGQCYPKTKSYGFSFLIEKMEAKGDDEGVSRLRQQGSYGYQDNYDYDYWKLGNKYKSKLNLSKDEVIFLNRLSYSSNNFSRIEYCCIEIIKLYLSTVVELKGKYTKEGTTIEEQFLTVADVIARKHFKYRNGSNNYKYSIEAITNECYSYIFKHCENAVREKHGHKRKINVEAPYYSTLVAKVEFEDKIISKVTEILSTLSSKIASPDEATEVEINSQNTSRWKVEFEDITANYKDNPKQFIESIVRLGTLNKKNPSIENIFFEASKFISKYNNEAALTLYVHYLYHDLKSATFDNKQLAKTIQKVLFKTNEQLHDFEIIVNELIKDKNLEKALQGVSKIYEVKRKKIQLNSASIKEVQQQHSGTVDLLNQYLKDEDENNLEVNKEEDRIEITQKIDKVHNSAYLSTIAFTPIHASTLEIFAKSNFSVPQSELETFAKSNGIFKNQLIESINEICYENLDDVLIEEEDEYYVINPNYYQRLLTK